MISAWACTAPSALKIIREAPDQTQKDAVLRMNNEAPFALSGLISREGLSNWVFLLLENRLGIDSLHPEMGGPKAFGDWSTELTAKAKRIVELRDEQLVKMKLMGHEVLITGPDGQAQKFGMMNRKQAERARESLGQRFGSSFEVTKSYVFEHLERRARFLL